MRKKTKRMLGVGAASAAAFAAGIIISATPAYAEEECMCEPDNHVEDCSCGCGDAAAAVREAESIEAEAQKDAEAAQKGESDAKKAAETASQEEKSAEESRDSAKAAYDKAVADEEASIADQKAQAEADEKAKSDALAEATVKEGQAETAANEAKAAADAAKDELDTAIGYKDGTLPIEDTEEYKKAQETQADLDKKTAERDAAQDAADKAKSEADEKEKALKAAQADHDAKKATADEKQKAQDDAQAAKDAAQQTQDANEQALNKAAEEKNAADKAVTDKTSEKEAADKAQEKATADHQKAKEDEEKAKAAYDEKLKDFAEGAFGFYQHIIDTETDPKKVADAESALNILKTARFASDTHKGSLTDATSLDNMLEAVKWIRESNRYRELDGAGAAVLNVTNELMAVAQSNTNRASVAWSEGHPDQLEEYNNAENLSRQSPDPFAGWYYGEKAIFDTGNRNYGAVGHYQNLTERELGVETPYGRIEIHTFTTGFAVNTGNGTTYGQDFSTGKGGYTVDEYETVLKAYYATVDPAEEKEAYEQAKVAAEAALAEKEAADKAAEDANNALKAAQDNQSEKQTAYDNAVTAEEKSRNDLQTAQTALDNAKQANEAAQAAFTDAQAELKNANEEKEAADTALEQANKALEEKKDAYNKAKEADEAADKVLADLMDVDAKQVVYDTAAARAKEVSDAYDDAKKAAEAAQTAYDEAGRALEVANMRKAEDAQTVKDALSEYNKAQEAYDAKAAIAKTKQAEYDKAKEAVAEAGKKLEKAQNAVAVAKTAQEAAQKLCDEKIRHKNITFKFNYVDKNGNEVDAFHTEMHVDGVYDEKGAFGHIHSNGSVVNTKSVIDILCMGQTGGLNELTLPDDYVGEVQVRFVTTDENGKEVLGAALYDKDGKKLTGDWFEIRGADLQGDTVQLIFNVLDVKKDITFKCSFRDKDGNDVGVIHTEMYFDGEYDYNSTFGHPGRTVSTNSVIQINTLAQTALNDKYRLPEEYQGEVYLKFTTLDENGKEVPGAALYDKAGNKLTGDWFEIKGADLQGDTVELIFKVLDFEAGTPVNSADQDTPVNPVTPSHSGGNKIAGGKTLSASSPVVVSARTTGNANVTTAASTGDAGYAQIAAYSVIAAAALAGIGVVLKRKKKAE